MILLLDCEIARNAGCDHGVAAQSIVLGAMEKGIGACIIGSIKRDRLTAELDIPERYEILLLVALGEPAEKVVLEESGSENDIRYYRDDNGVHHVPKRSLETVIVPIPVAAGESG